MIQNARLLVAYDLQTGEPLQYTCVDRDLPWTNLLMTPNGYIEAVVPEPPGRIALHRLVAGCVRGDGLHVHHRNHLKRDNRRANLQILTPGEHRCLHERQGGKFREWSDTDREVAALLDVADRALWRLRRSLEDADADLAAGRTRSAADMFAEFDRSDAIRRHRGEGAGDYPPGYLEREREGWPA